MRQKLYVDNVDLSTYGVYISGDGTFSAAEKNYTFETVPNRNEAVLGTVRDIADINVSYACFIYSNFDTNIEGLRNFLLSRNGFVKISDTYHPTEYRMGVYQGAFDPTVTKKLDAGKFVLTFRCKPQRWLVSGDTPITLEPTGSSWQYINLPNPTLFDAKPILRIYGTGSIELGTKSITIDSAVSTLGYSYVDLDCEKMTCTNGDVNLSSYVSVDIASALFKEFGTDLPFIPVGYGHFIFPENTGVTKIEVTPRWWVM